MLPAQFRPLSEPMLFAVLAGTVRFTVDGALHELHQRAALWVPAGAEVRVQQLPGSVVLPVPAQTSGSPVAVPVPVAADDVMQLLRAFVSCLGHLDAEPQVAPVLVPNAADHLQPPLPTSSELRDLADLLADDPDLNLAAAVDAAVTGWSVRTVQRRFTAETGLSLSAWVRRTRVHAATEYLNAGRDVEWVAHRVGYRSSAAFIRAFTEVAGTTPGRWGRATASPARTAGGGAGEPGGSTSDRDGDNGSAGGNRDADAALRLPQLADAAPQEHRTWSRVNGGHVAIWIAAGTADILIADRRIALAAGDAVVLPAGVRNEVRLSPGALLVPVGYRSGRTGAVGLPVTAARLSPAGELEMIASLVAAYTKLSAPGVDPDHGFAAVLHGSERTRVDAGDDRLAALASLVARQPDVEVAEASGILGCDERELRALVRARSGETWLSWQRLVRMTRARNRLGSGEAAGPVSRDLGYAHLPAFSRAFHAVHGTAPSEVRSAGAPAGSSLLRVA